jgi:hypothetical protein
LEQEDEVAVTEGEEKMVVSSGTLWLAKTTKQHRGAKPRGPRQPKDPYLYKTQQIQSIPSDTVEVSPCGDIKEYEQE